jgi:diaminopimelate decarboxylase
MAQYREVLQSRFGGRAEEIIVEPGRSLVGEAGLLLARVEYIKPGEGKTFVIVDAAMNDLMRPALYDAFHDIVPVDELKRAPVPCDVVGPVCETGDFIGLGRHLAIEEGGLLAILAAGAYGMSMSSNYNSRPRAAEVVVSKNEIYLVRERETIEGMIAGERLIY